MEAITTTVVDFAAAELGTRFWGSNYDVGCHVHCRKVRALAGVVRRASRPRLVQLDDEITKLQRSRDLLAAALLCRFDHPLDECKIMNAEIDRRLADNPAH